METRENMKPETISKLQDLISINIDSAKGCADAAEKIEDEAIGRLLSRLGTERAQQAEDLKRFVRLSDEEPTDSGTAKGTARRYWMDLRGALNKGDAHVVLAEAEKGEDVIKHAYEEALKETAGSPVNDVLQAQYAQVKTGHDHVRELRDLKKGA